MYQYGYGLNEFRDRKVVIYARVSTEHEAQLSALENQKEWYKPFLEHHPEWEVVGMYVDEGITGTSASKRPQFMQMIADAEAGKFDLILTREVSRFARNTVDTLQYTRKLKAKGVEVFFINDNIKTFDGDGELRLTIMATLAQDESRKTSIRVKSGQQTSMKNGTFYGNGNILGYDRVGKDLVVNPEQAKTVRMIYNWYLDGIGMRAIQFKLEQLGRLTSTGKTNWHVSNISKILKNSFYCGIITYHKQFTPDYLEQKKINNFGDIELLKVEGRHEALISVEDFEKVQKMLASKRKTIANLEHGKHVEKGARLATTPWSFLAECECGHKFCRRAWHKDNKEEMMRYAYQCYQQTRTGTVGTRIRKGLSIEDTCRTPMVPEWKFQMMLKYLFNQYMTNTKAIMRLAESLLTIEDDEDDLSEEQKNLIEEYETKIAAENKRYRSALEMAVEGDISKEEFREIKEDCKNKILELQQELDKLKNPVEDVAETDVDYSDKITLLKECLEVYADPKRYETEPIPDHIILSFVKKIVVHENSFDWYLRFSYPDDGNDVNNPCKLGITGNKRSNSSEVVELDKSSESDTAPTLLEGNTGCNQRSGE